MPATRIPHAKFPQFTEKILRTFGYARKNEIPSTFLYLGNIFKYNMSIFPLFHVCFVLSFNCYGGFFCFGSYVGLLDSCSTKENRSQNVVVGIFSTYLLPILTTR